MEAASLIRRARQEAGLSKRELARRAGTSPAAVVLYEQGRREPSLPTLQRLLAASGHRLDLVLRVGPDLPPVEVLSARLEEVLELAEHLPTKPAARRLRYPRLPS